MKNDKGEDLTEADFSPAELLVVERVGMTLRLAVGIAATPDQIMPLATLVMLAWLAADQEQIQNEMERLGHR